MPVAHRESGSAAISSSDFAFSDVNVSTLMRVANGTQRSSTTRCQGHWYVLLSRASDTNTPDVTNTAFALPIEICRRMTSQAIGLPFESNASASGAPVNDRQAPLWHNAPLGVAQ